MSTRTIRYLQATADKMQEALDDLNSRVNDLALGEDDLISVQSTQIARNVRMGTTANTETTQYRVTAFYWSKV